MVKLSIATPYHIHNLVDPDLYAARGAVCMLVYQLEIISVCMETMWQCETSSQTSCISAYQALLLVTVDFICTRIGSGVHVQQ